MAPEAQRVDAKLRFDVYEADPRSGELRKHGIRIPLEDRPFRALLILLSRGNELVTREELQKRLWSSDVFIDFDHGLNTVIRKIRRALNDNADEPRFIETVGGHGYRFLATVEQQARIAPEQTSVESAVPKPFIVPQEPQEAAVAVEPPSTEIQRTYAVGRRAILAITAGALVLLLAYALRPAAPLPKVGRIVQLTKSGGAVPENPLYTDGPRVYYESIDEKTAHWQLRQVVLNGNGVTPVDIPSGFLVRGLSPDDTEFLAINPNGEAWTVWTIAVAGGSPRRVGNLAANDIAWSHDGNWFAYSLGNQLLLAKADGTSSRSLVTVPVGSEWIYHARWSPDDTRLRFTEFTWSGRTHTLWEVGADGRNLHQLRFNWPGDEQECCGEWTPDGRYFVFISSREGVSNLWAMQEKTDWWRRAIREPVPLTSGPLGYYQLIPGRNGKSIYAIGAQPSGELVRYDADRKDFVPFLGGRSIDRVVFSRDGQWLAYLDYPEGTLWRARSDGTEQLQLTFPPLKAVSPRWSPDGKRIAFHGKQPGQLYRNFMISAEGGNPEPFPPEALSQAYPDWMPSGDALIYSRVYGVENPGLYRFDLRTGRSEKIVGSDGLYGARWSPDGRYLSAIEAATNLLLLVDLKTGKRTPLASPAWWPSWSVDSQYLYFNRDSSNWIFRVRVPDGSEEKVLEVPFRSASRTFTLAPDGSPIILREHGRYDVYSLALSVP